MKYEDMGFCGECFKPIAEKSVQCPHCGNLRAVDTVSGRDILDAIAAHTQTLIQAQADNKQAIVDAVVQKLIESADKIKLDTVWLDVAERIALRPKLKAKN